MIRCLTGIAVRYAQRFIPDPYLYAVLLTFITAASAYLLTPAAPAQIVEAWYNGIWDILAFAAQMALILATGVALAEAPTVKRLLQKLAGIPSRQVGAVILVYLVGSLASWLNWGFGLVVGALLAREVAKHVRDVDFGLAVAAAYMGNMVWASGLSSSIALATATPGSALNIIETVTGAVPGFDRTVFATYNLVPVFVLVAVMPFALASMAPDKAQMKRIDPALLVLGDPPVPPKEDAATLATRLENTPVITLLLVAMGATYESYVITTRGFSLDIDGMIFIALMLGLIFHLRPIRYVYAFNAAARTVGPILLQFPLYGGIMGMMTGTGLAAVIAKAFVAFSTARTLPFWSFVSSNIISLFVPSGGGHWAVQGPFMIPAAVALHVDPAMTAMATAMGEQTANMIQPFWALPVLAIAGLGIRDIMGYSMMAFFVGLAVYGSALLVFG
jgi:short-chain fatty acids transporter